MSLFSDAVQRVRALLFRRAVEAELEEEIATHLELETAARRNRGVTTDQARRQALLAFGGVERWKEATREARGLGLVAGLGLDLRQSLRALRRNPGFTLSVILVLGTGVGLATTVLSLVRTVVWNELPYPAADRLVRVYQQNRPDNLFGLSTVDAQAILARQHSFDAFGVVQRGEVALSGLGAPERIPVARVTPGFFEALSLRAESGRLVTDGDLANGAPPVAVVSHAFAEPSLGGAGPAIGKSFLLDGIAHTVIGVLPPGGADLGGVTASVWPALRLAPPTRRGPFYLRGIGRLRPGVSLEAAARDLAGVSAQVYPEWAASFRDQEAKLTPYPLRTTIVGDSGNALLLLAGAVVLVLLVAIANVATLMLVRGSARGTELAVRNALGAGRGRLVRLLLAESGLLSLGVLAVSLLVTAGGVAFLQRELASLPRVSEVGFDPGTLLLAVGLALASGLFVTLSPIVTLLLRQPGGPVSVRSGVSPGVTRVRRWLVAGEFALALPLLFGAALLVHSFVRLSRVNPGFDPVGVVALDLALPRGRYPDPAATQRFLSQAESRAVELFGAGQAGMTTALPPDDPGDVNNFDLLDQPVAPGTSEPVAAWSVVTPGYFTVLGIPLLEGRSFEPFDTGGPAPVAVVSRSWANRYYPNGSAVGHQLYSGGCHDCPPVTVVGVVGDVKYLGLSGSAEAVYEPSTQAAPNRVNLLVRGSDAGAAALTLQSAMGALDPELPLRPLLLESRVRDSLADPRRWMSLVAAFALITAGLASFGVYGLMAYLVRQRRREIGIRLALGAPPSQVTADVMLRGVRYALAGSLVGLGLALAGAKWIEQLLFGVSARDPLTLAAVLLVLLLVALVSCWIPGRRAARVNLPSALGSGD
ncbi:MAG: ADOP family duplicated permease [Gemmatimonadales bacterium]